MITLHIHSLGKNKSPWLIEVIDIYTSRLKSTYEIQWHLHKKEDPFYQSIHLLKSWIYLSEKGECTDSITFSKKLTSWVERAGGNLHFVIGGDTGLPPALVGKAAAKLSLSPMTLTHQMVRALFLEQLYRATQIHQGTPYHK